MIALYPEFFNDVFGPIMQPGSSSHMAGPCRAGILCNSLLNEEVSDICIELDKDGSMAGTLGTMNEDTGMLNGAIGNPVDHPDFFEIKTILKKRNISYNIDICSMKESAHSNAMKFIIKGVSGKTVSMVANSTGGGMVETVWVNGYKFSGFGDTYVLFVTAPEGAAVENELTEKIRAAHEVLETGIGTGHNGGTVYWFKMPEKPDDGALSFLKKENYSVMKPVLPVISNKNRQPQFFNTMTQWRAIAKEQNKTMFDVAVDYETAASGWPREKIIDYMQNRIQKTMHRRIYAIASGTEAPAPNAFFPASYKNWGNKMKDAKLVQGLFAKSIYYVSCARVQCPGVLDVPGPMGSGGGFISGILHAVKEEFNLSDEDILRGLFIAAGIGAICYTRTNPTGEVIGCAGECGCCSAMAAAAVVEMLHGTPQQIESAASLALQNAVGWPCDIIPGGQGMPCGSRILSVAVMSIVFAQWALIDEDPVLPFHEVVDVADRVGRSMDSGMLCTARGGMCSAPTAQKIMENFKRVVQ
ncbi:MAG: L-serine ammonia-lyase, iron-sulfur-dependent, subunit alpha [Treponema sp.]|jgi:L-serine dehydratase|nr:L-serine ammonia-lyase, iron-sulfur-dependent, subunit alpha [Treponema sp.]